ncbi:M48 family metallopeptidase [Streptomyces sp. NPDC048384]|uniref:M48 family metallopeptidase n=1 Tax=Streptomyces sp. NPDC048384 TaxID=3155487 RepID=UPI00342B0136
MRALILLAGFYLLGFVMLGALVAVDWAVAEGGVGSVTAKVWIVSALLAIPIVQGMFALRTPKDEPPPGLLATEQQEPTLWAAVRTLAEETGTRAPDEIVLTPDVNAAVAEDATFLGLKPGRRRMYIGLPLMAGLSEPQLRAVLAHEFGHYTNHDTRLSAITLRGRLQVLRTVASLHERSRKKVGLLFWQDRYEAAAEQFRLVDGYINAVPWSYRGGRDAMIKAYVQQRDFSAAQVVKARGGI